MTTLEEVNADHRTMEQMVAAGIICGDCYVPTTNGVCNGCTYAAMLNTCPHYRAYAEASNRLDEGHPDDNWWKGEPHPYTRDEAEADKRVVTRYERAQALIERAARVEPNACRYCRTPQRQHCQRYHEGRGWEGWQEPTDRQRLNRMIARRHTRRGTPHLAVARMLELTKED